MAALLAVDDVIATLLARARPLVEAEQVSLADCYGRVLAQDLVSAIDVPQAANSSMDGYAVNTRGLARGARLPISDRIAAGAAGAALRAGTAARIFTGAPLPDGADAVVIQEDTTLADDNTVIINEVPAPNENVRPAGQDIRRGTVILPQGRRLTPADVALAASVGNASLDVYRRLRVAVMSNGDELVDPPGQLAVGQIYNSNLYALLGLIRALDMEAIDLGLVRDNRAETEAALLRGAASADCVLTSGGVSVGEEDHVRAALSQLGELTLWRIAIKPGKPLAFGRIGDVPFFGLPGNPVSTFVTFTMIARPYLLKCQGATDVLPRPLYADAAFAMAAGSRREYVRVQLAANASGDLQVTPFGNQGSGVMSSLAWANALAEVDVGQEVRVGDRLKIYLLGH
ncbi:MAG: gephyrin-like molybdotransferase Glp [Pseudomonadota bacterium]